MPAGNWSVPCTAHRSDGASCSNWSIIGGYVCRNHGGSVKRVRAAVARRWELELVIRQVEREFERETGQPPSDIQRALIHYPLGHDPATYRRHVRTHPLPGEDAEADSE